MSAVKLRRSYTPYWGMTIAVLIYVASLVFIAIATDDWLILFEFGWLPPCLLIAWIAIGLRYSVSYSDESVSMTASGVKCVAIKYKEISSVKSEASIEKGRPFRRIAIYSHHGFDKEFIDISLKHFMVYDIKILFERISRERPDLQLPRIHK